MPIISIIIPIYHTAREYLEKSIESAIDQTFKDFEIILVDDGSPDECSKICDDYALQDDRIRVIHKENGGTASARNSGIENAGGDWLMFLDADDWLELDACETLLNGSDPSRHSDIVIGAVYQNYGDNLNEVPSPYPCGTTLSGSSELEDLQEKILGVAADGSGANLCIISTCGKLYRKRLFSDYKLRFNANVIFSEDSLFNLYAYQYADSVSFVNEYVLHYRYNDVSKVNSYRPDADREQIAYLTAVQDFIDAYKSGDARFHKAYALRVFLSVQMLLSQKYFNRGSRDGYCARRKQFQTLLHTEPYSGAMQKISPKELSRNHRIKYALIHCGFYQTADTVRTLYLRKTGKR